MPTATIRTARADDIHALTELMHIATGGFIRHVVAEMAAPGEDPGLLLTGRMQDPTSQLHLEKAQVVDEEGRIAGFVMTELIADPADLSDPGTSDVLKSLLKLENLAPRDAADQLCRDNSGMARARPWDRSDDAGRTGSRPQWHEPDDPQTEHRRVPVLRTVWLSRGGASPECQGRLVEGGNRMGADDQALAAVSNFVVSAGKWWTQS